MISASLMVARDDRFDSACSALRAVRQYCRACGVGKNGSGQVRQQCSGCKPLRPHKPGPRHLGSSSGLPLHSHVHATHAAAWATRSSLVKACTEKAGRWSALAAGNLASRGQTSIRSGTPVEDSKCCKCNQSHPRPAHHGELRDDAARGTRHVPPFMTRPPPPSVARRRLSHGHKFQRPHIPTVPPQSPLMTK